MTAADFVETCAPKRRGRPKGITVARRQRMSAVAELAGENHPASIRNIYYRAVVAGLVAKNDSGYGMVQRDLAELRKAGDVPYSWITDNVRWRRMVQTFDTVADALADTAELYRRNLWTSAPETVEVWCESDSIAGVLWPVCHRWAVPLLPMRGFSSLTFAHSAAEELNAAGRDAVVYYVGDLDPHGLDIEHSLRGYLDDWCEIDWQMIRLGVTARQADEFDLPGTVPKRKGFVYGRAVEAEALPPRWLRDQLDAALAGHVDGDELAVLEAVEADERELLHRLARLEVSR